MEDKKLTTFEKCENIKHLLLTTIAELLIYDSWNDEFNDKPIEVVKRWQKKTKQSYAIDPNDLTMKEMKHLGFIRWEEKTDLMLIPIWLYPFLAKKIVTFDIGYKKHTKYSEIDKESRFGYLGYGVYTKEFKIEI